MPSILPTNQPPPRLTREMVNIATFAGVEVLVMAVTVIFFPKPQVIVFMTLIAVAFFALRLMWMGAVRAKFQTAQSNMNYALKSVVVAILIAGLTWVALGDFAVRRMYEGGSFGEPPNNRIITVHEVVGGSAPYAAVVEFSVASYTVPGLNTRVIFDDGDGYDRERAQWFLGKPSKKTITDIDRIIEIKENRLNVNFSRESPASNRFELYGAIDSVTTDRSLYVYYWSESPITITGCLFRRSDESSGGICWEQITPTSGPPIRDVRQS